MSERESNPAAIAIAIAATFVFGASPTAWARTNQGVEIARLQTPSDGSMTGHDAASRESALTRMPDPLTLSWCIERAAEANPEIAEMAALAEAARQRIVPSGALDDPRLSYEASNIPTGDFNFDSTPLSGHQFGLRQKLPFPGLLSAREEAAEKISDAATFDLSDRRRTIESEVESNWSQLGFAQRALAITDRNIDLLRHIVRIAETRYSVGSGLQQDVLRAQVELTALLQERFGRVAAVETSSARLAALLDLPPSTPFSDTSSLEDASPVPRLEPLYGQTSQTNAKLKSLRAEVEAAKFSIRAVELAGLPDVDFGLGYRLRQNVSGDPVDGDDFVSAAVTIRLPVNRSKWRAQEAESRALLRRAKATLRRHEAALQAKLHTAHAQLVRADQEAELLRTGLVPQALQSLEASRSAYEVGRIDLLSLLDSQVRFLTAQLREVRAASDRRAAFGALESVVGEDLR